MKLRVKHSLPLSGNMDAQYKGTLLKNVMKKEHIRCPYKHTVGGHLSVTPESPVSGQIFGDNLSKSL